MSDKLYVNKPGGVVVHLEGGGSENLYYGDPVDKHGPLADYIDPRQFADPNPRNVGAGPEVDAHTRAALDEGGQVNSSSSAVPGNYRDLEEDAAAQLVRNLARYPAAQAEIILHEVLYCHSRQKVLDAASEFAVVKAHATIEAARQANDPQYAEPTRPGTDPVLTGDLGDPEIDRFGPEAAERNRVIQERALRLSGGKGGQTPAPRGSQRSTTEDFEPGEPGSDEDREAQDELRREVEARHGSDDPDGGEVKEFEDYTKADLQRYAEQHEIEHAKSDNKTELIQKLQAAGHERPETPL